jgi:putative redox protein
MEAKVEWKRDEVMSCTASNGSSMELDGGGEGISPVVATLQAAGACSLLDLVVGLKEREVTSASVDLSGERAEDFPKVFTNIHMVYRVAGVGLPEKLCRRLIEQSLAKYCTVSNSLNAEFTWELLMDS